MTSAAEHRSLADVKDRLSEVMEGLEREHGRVVITQHGRPAAVVLDVEDLGGLGETLSVLSDPKLMRRVRRVKHELTLELAGVHPGRRGDLRVRSRITEDQKMPTIISIDHRADAYSRREALPSLAVSRDRKAAKLQNGRQAAHRPGVDQHGRHTSPAHSYQEPP